MADWRVELWDWLALFLAKLRHKARRRMCPLYVAGLILCGGPDRAGRAQERWPDG
jgi:hypothetical protein